MLEEFQVSKPLLVNISADNLEWAEFHLTDPLIGLFYF